MARTDSAVLPHEETSPAQEEFFHPEMDARFTNLDEEDKNPFLRKQKRVPVRRGPLPKKTTNLLKWLGLAVCLFTALGIAYAFVYRYGERSWRFRVESSDQIEVEGAKNVTHGQVMDVLGSDIGRNIFFVPLDERRAQLELIPWVESAAIMRFVPNRLKVEVRERTPVAFVRIGSHIGLIDNTGHIMEIPAHNKTKYSFPVIAGTRDSEPLSTRAVRMTVFNELVRELDSEGGHYSTELSEVDLTDPEDARVLVDDPAGNVLLHLGSVNSGSGNFLDRFKLYKAHVSDWRQQFEKLDSVDLRYERQIVVNPDLRSPSQPAALSPSAKRAALVAGVPAMAITAAALVKREQAAAKRPLVPVKPTAMRPAPDPRGTGASPVHRSAATAPKPANPSTTKPSANPITPAALKQPIHVQKAAKKAKPSPHKHGKATKHLAKKSPGHKSAAKTVKPASIKSRAPAALAPAKPHQVLKPKLGTSNKGKPHAAIVYQ